VSQELGWINQDFIRAKSNLPLAASYFQRLGVRGDSDGVDDLGFSVEHGHDVKEHTESAAVSYHLPQRPAILQVNFTPPVHPRASLFSVESLLARVRSGNIRGSLVK
jgi:hypothetical protein